MKTEILMKRPKILVADDSDDMFYLIKKGFEGENYEFLRARNGLEALEILEKELPDLILLDLKMPGKDGMEVLESVRGNSRFSGIPILVLTVVDSSEEKIKALQVGAEDFLIKPLDPAELRARVKTHLKLKKATDELKSYSEKLEKMVENKTRQLREYAQTLEEKVEEKVGLIREKNKQLMVSIDAASKVQLSLLPSRLPEIGGIEFRAGYFPCESISGDFYDVFRIDEKNIGFFVADVSGHGVPSAMITIFLKQELIHHIKILDRKNGYRLISPGEVLMSFNKKFIDLNIGEGLYYITMVYGIINTDTRVITLSSAGHHALPIIIRSDSEDFELLDKTGFPIGWVREEHIYPDSEFDLGKGGTVLIYTDGLIEIYKHLKRENSTEKIFSHIVKDLKERKDFSDYIEKSVEKILRKNNKLMDDVTYLLMRVKKEK